MRKLFVFANAFPFGEWEPYLATELSYVKNFDEIHIWSLSVRREQLRCKRALAHPCVHVHPILFRRRITYILFSFRALFDFELYRELAKLATSRRLRFARIARLFATLTRVHLETKDILRVISSRSLVDPSDSVVMYSYRFAYQPYLMRRVALALSQPVKLVSRAHGSDLYEAAAPHAYHPLRLRSIEWMDRVVLISDHGFEYLQRVSSGCSDNLAVSKLGTDDSGLGPVPDSGSRLLIVSCAVVVSGKRLELLVRSLAKLGDLQVEWTHIGDGPELSAVSRLAKDILPPTVRVRFAGSLANDEVLALYAEEPFHCFVSVSKSEGIPVSMMEAMSFGIPVVSTDVGGVGEIVDDSNGVLLAANPTPVDVASVLRRVQEMPESVYADLRRGARDSWSARFKAETNYPAFFDSLIEL